jgi:hypothetical protein
MAFRGLTPRRIVEALTAMNMKLVLALVGVVGLIGAGCVSKVSGGHTAGVPFVKDKIEGRYQRPVDVVFNAAKAVISDRGTLNNESIVHGETNQVKTLVGTVEKRTVYVRVQPVDQQVTSVMVQTRTPGGVSDLDLAHQLEKEIALRLVQ